MTTTLMSNLHYNLYLCDQLYDELIHIFYNENPTFPFTLIVHKKEGKNLHSNFYPSPPFPFPFLVKRTISKEATRTS